MFRLKPASRSPISVSSTDTGMDTAVTRVERRLRRKIRITTTAISRPSPPSTSRSWMDWVMKGAWSKTVVKVGSLPSAAAIPGGRIVHLHHNKHELTWMLIDGGVPA